jgi:hypothetical protein
MMKPPLFLCGFFLEDFDDADGKVGEYGDQDDPEQLIRYHGQTDCQQDKGQKDGDDTKSIEEFYDTL